MNPPLALFLIWLIVGVMSCFFRLERAWLLITSVVCFILIPAACIKVLFVL